MSLSLAAAVMKFLAVAGMLAVLVGDVTIGALVAGVFSTLNLFINAVVLKRVDETRRSVKHVDAGVDETRRGVQHTHKILTAPRQALYDDQGKVIGTMIRLDTDEDWMGRVIPPQRAQDAEEETP